MSKLRKDDRVGIIQNGRLLRSNLRTTKVSKLQWLNVLFMSTYMMMLYDVRAPCGKCRSRTAKIQHEDVHIDLSSLNDIWDRGRLCHVLKTGLPLVRDVVKTRETHNR